MEKKKKMTKEKVKQWAKKHELEIGCCISGAAVIASTAMSAYLFDRNYVSVKKNTPLGAVLTKVIDNDLGYGVVDAVKAGAEAITDSDGTTLKPTDFIVVGNLIKKSE